MSGTYVMLVFRIILVIHVCELSMNYFYFWLFKISNLHSAKNESKNNYLKLGDQSQPNSNVLLY
jgi:hypothetical protein